MRINFFEEFPTKENLGKLRLIDFPTTVYIAARSLAEFQRIASKIKKKNVTFGYWPLLKQEEGYWFSAFSSTKGIQRIINEFRQSKKKLDVLWDAELPTLRKRLFVQNIFSVVKNRRIIHAFLGNPQSNLRIVTAEYPFKNKWFLNMFALCHPNENKRIYMIYSSHLKYLEGLFEKGKKRIGIGCIATGIMGNEKVISPEQLDKDLALAKRFGVKEATIFRLSGLNKEYLKIIKKYI